MINKLILCFGMWTHCFLPFSAVSYLSRILSNMRGIYQNILSKLLYPPYTQHFLERLLQLVSIAISWIPSWNMCICQEDQFYFRKENSTQYFSCGSVWNSACRTVTLNYFYYSGYFSLFWMVTDVWAPSMKTIVSVFP